MIFCFENITNKYGHLKNKSKLIAMITKTEIRVELLTLISIHVIILTSFTRFFFYFTYQGNIMKTKFYEIIIAHYCGGSNASCRRKPKKPSPFVCVAKAKVHIKVIIKYIY